MIYKVDKDKIHYCQRNNEIKPFESCNVTSMVMALDYKGYADQFPKGNYKQPEDNLRHYIETNPDCIRIYENFCRSNTWARGIPAPQIHDVLSMCTNLWMGKTVTRFQWNMRITEILNEIKEGRPVVISGDFQRPGKEPLGHIVVLVGYNDETQEVCYDDPFGKTYAWGPNNPGNDCWVSWELFIRDIKDCGVVDRKWAHIFFDKETFNTDPKLPPQGARIATSDRTAQNGDYWLNPSTSRWMLLTNGKWNYI